MSDREVLYLERGRNMINLDKRKSGVIGAVRRELRANHAHVEPEMLRRIAVSIQSRIPASVLFSAKYSFAKTTLTITVLLAFKKILLKMENSMPVVPSALSSGSMNGVIWTATTVVSIVSTRRSLFMLQKSSRQSLPR